MICYLHREGSISIIQDTHFRYNRALTVASVLSDCHICQRHHYMRVEEIKLLFSSLVDSLQLMESEFVLLRHMFLLYLSDIPRGYEHCWQQSCFTMIFLQWWAVKTMFGKGNKVWTVSIWRCRLFKCSYSYYEGKTLSRPSYLYNGNPYT